MSTIAAISTPQAAGGIGVIRISGEDAVKVAAKVFFPMSGEDITDLKGYRAKYGKIVYEGEKIDEAVCLVFRAPKSYTGEDVVEISCHGGLYVLQKTLRAVLASGAVAAGAGEFTKRAFLNGKMDLTEAEAVMGIISAKGEQAAKAAMNTLDGTLSKKISEICHSVVEVSAALGAWVDYPDEDIEEMSEEEIAARLTRAKNSLDSLLDKFDAGRAITEGVDTAIVGKPNVGKSTLMNLLTGYERSIVTHVAGTTRDIVEETVRVGDVVLRLADTAGIHDTEDEVESIGVNLAREKLERATLILAVFDSSRPLDSEDKKILEYCRDKACIAIINKSDLEEKLDEKAVRDAVERVVKISAESGDGYDELKVQVESLLGTDKLDTSAAMLTTERQRASALEASRCLEEALSALQSGLTLDAVNVSADCAVQALLELTGEKASDAVVDEVFSTFCVGK